ncbi:hypothetical protein MMC12_004981 [Toensbergia leucococca]|nr:hypothetical protein [Toensbergia leucococca]
MTLATSHSSSSRNDGRYDRGSVANMTSTTSYSSSSSNDGRYAPHYSSSSRNDGRYEPQRCWGATSPDPEPRPPPEKPVKK